MNSCLLFCFLSNITFIASGIFLIVHGHPILGFVCFLFITIPNTIQSSSEKKNDN